MTAAPIEGFHPEPTAKCQLRLLPRRTQLSDAEPRLALLAILSASHCTPFAPTRISKQTQQGKGAPTIAL